MFEKKENLKSKLNALHLLFNQRRFFLLEWKVIQGVSYVCRITSDILLHTFRSKLINSFYTPYIIELKNRL